MGLVGEAPDGFDTCDFDECLLKELVGVHLVPASRQGFTLLTDVASAWRAFDEGAVLVSEPLAWHLDLATGARLTLFVIPARRLATGTLESNIPIDVATAAQLGTGWIDGRELLGMEDYYRRDTHWRASGHEKAAAAIAAHLGNPGPQ